MNIFNLCTKHGMNFIYGILWDFVGFYVILWDFVGDNVKSQDKTVVNMTCSRGRVGDFNH